MKYVHYRVRNSGGGEQAPTGEAGGEDSSLPRSVWGRAVQAAVGLKLCSDVGGAEMGRTGDLRTGDLWQPSFCVGATVRPFYGM